MNAEVLMIGDRIRQKESGLLLQVSEIRPPYIIAVGEYGQFHENSIEPIQLTPEILVANGFESRELYHFTLYQLGKESFSIAYDLMAMGLNFPRFYRNEFRHKRRAKRVIDKLAKLNDWRAVE